jgi:hypothetical protein
MAPGLHIGFEILAVHELHGRDAILGAKKESGFRGPAAVRE